MTLSLIDDGKKKVLGGTGFSDGCTTKVIDWVAER